MAQFKLKRGVTGRLASLLRSSNFPYGSFPPQHAEWPPRALGPLRAYPCCLEWACLPCVSFSTHFAFLSGGNIPGSIAGSPQALSQNLQLLIRSLLYSRRSRRLHNFQLSGAKKSCF